LATIQHKVGHGVQSANGAICGPRLVTANTTYRQQARDALQSLVDA